MNNGSPHFVSSAQLLSLILKPNSCSICENHPRQLPPVASSVISLKCPSWWGKSVFMTFYQALMGDSWTKILSSMFSGLQCWVPSNSLNITLSTLPFPLCLTDNIHLHTFLFNNNPQAELRGLFFFFFFLAVNSHIFLFFKKNKIKQQQKKPQSFTWGTFSRLVLAV